MSMATDIMEAKNQKACTKEKIVQAQYTRKYRLVAKPVF